MKLQPALNRETFLANAIYRRLLEQRIGDVAVAEVVPLHSSLGNNSETPSQKKKKNPRENSKKQYSC